MGLVHRRARAAAGLLLAATAAASLAIVALTGLTGYGRQVVDAGTRTAVDSAAARERSILVRGPAGRSTTELAQRDAALRAAVADGVGGRPAVVTSRNLLPYLTARENVALPMTLAGRARGRAARNRAGELLELVGIADRADRRPEQLSGGEQQRCAVAVAVANDPEVLFADEPTGELDESTAEEVFAALRTINAELGVTIVVVTHDRAVAGQVRRTVAIRDGRTASEVRRSARVGHDGVTETVTEEYAVLDRGGRLQLPAAFVDALSLRDRVRLNLEPDHVEVRSGDLDAAEE